MAEIDHRHLRSALEFAVLIANEGQKRRPALAFPKELKPFLSTSRLPSGSLGRVRRIIEADTSFRGAMSAGALPELVDEVGRLWLAGASGWEPQAQRLIDEAAEEGESKDLRRELKRADKRRVSAEQAAARIQADVLARDRMIEAQVLELDGLRADLTKSDDELAEVRTELIDTRNELRHARDREAAAKLRSEQVASARSAHSVAPVPADTAPVEVVADGAAERSAEAAFVQQAKLIDDAQRRLEEARTASQAFAAEMERLVAGGEVGPDNGDGVRSLGDGERVPMVLPGGVIATSGEAAAHLVRSGAAVIVDGYNVAKLGWPDRRLDEQRDALVARVENLARRHGADITIVFDGDSVVGAHARSRRLVRVIYSPTGITADDVIRAEVDRLPFEQAIVVVTNDREIVDDVRRAGANVVPSNAFFAVL